MSEARRQASLESQQGQLQHAKKVLRIPACHSAQKGGRAGTKSYVVGAVHEETCNALTLLEMPRFHSAAVVQVCRKQGGKLRSKANKGSCSMPKRCFESTSVTAGAGALGQLVEQLLAQKRRSESPAEN